MVCRGGVTSFSSSACLVALRSACSFRTIRTNLSLLSALSVAVELIGVPAPCCGYFGELDRVPVFVKRGKCTKKIDKEICKKVLIKKKNKQRRIKHYEKKARCVPTIVSAALSLTFPLHSVLSYLAFNDYSFCTIRFFLPFHEDYYFSTEYTKREQKWSTILTTVEGCPARQSG